MLRTVIISIAALVLAGLSGAAAFGASVGKFRPDMALGIPIANGPVLAASARLQMARAAAEKQSPESVAELFPEAVGARVLKKAQHAFAREPMSSDAIMVMALAADAGKETVRARKLFELGHDITRRNALISLWLGQDAARAGKVPETLRYFDELLRGNRQSRALLLQQFALATSDEAFREEMTELLGKDPPWAADFWAVAPDVKQAARPVGELRLALAGRGIEFDRYSDEKIAINLVSTGNFDLAVALYQAISGESSRDGRQIVRNAGFDKERLFPPVDWQTFSNGDRGSEIAAKEGMLFLFVINGPEAPVARQWVRTPPGTYRLTAKLQSSERAPEDTIRALLYCVRGDSALTRIAIPLNEGATDRRFTVPEGSCEDRWLDIMVEPAEKSPGFDAELDMLRIERIGS